MDAPGVGLSDPRVVACLACPHCGASFERVEGRLVCAAGHSFDVARQGYVNLLAGRDPGTGDDAAMVAARDEVLSSGRFASLTGALCRLVATHAPAEGCLVDVGAGTGHHLAAVLDVVPDTAPPDAAPADRVGVAIDLSRHAVRRAARRHPRLGVVVADVWQGLPVATGVVAAVLCVFAPRNAAEMARVLRPDGVLVVATPTPYHLGELAAPIGLLDVDPAKPERLAATLDPAFERVGDVVRLEETWRLDHDEIAAIVRMGPSADHLDPDGLAERVAALPARPSVTAAIELRTWRPR